MTTTNPPAAKSGDSPSSFALLTACSEVAGSHIDEKTVPEFVRYALNTVKGAQLPDRDGKAVAIYQKLAELPAELRAKAIAAVKALLEAS